jgi:hypothetical protein
MKSIISKSLTTIAITLTLLSFSTNPSKKYTFGGEGFEILLNGKVLLQQFGKDMNIVKNLRLNAASPGDKLTVRYHHCGQAGKNRVIAVKDAQNKLLKEWRFNDVQRAAADMSCSMQDLLTLKKDAGNVFKLYYSSDELPAGRQLALISFENTDKVQP